MVNKTLDATTLRELIGSNGRLVAEDPAPGFPRVAIRRPPSPTMQDLYDRMGNMEIHQGVLERMEPTHHPGTMRSSNRRSSDEMTRVGI
nr:hypothetical protein [Tanacetum cinerariifolium]